jgi:hypothetical protein
MNVVRFAIASKLAPGPIQPPIQRVPEVLTTGVKRLGREGNYSPLSSADVKSAWNNTSTHPYVFIAWYLVNHKDLALQLPF